MKVPFLPVWIGRGATASEFQIGPLYGGIRHLRFWRTSGPLYFRWDPTWSEDPSPDPVIEGDLYAVNTSNGWRLARPSPERMWRPNPDKDDLVWSAEPSTAWLGHVGTERSYIHLEEGETDGPEAR